MSRVGKKPIPVPEKTKLTYSDGVLTVEGQKGRLSRPIHPDVKLQIEADTIRVIPLSESKTNLALQGLTRSLVSNMVVGVNSGFEKVLEITGIGYRAEVKGNSLVLNLGFSHPINFDLPDGISAVVDRNNVVKLSGIDKEKLGQTAASIRRLRPPEPYKAKGIKYADEYIRRKAGKTGTK
ncbi:MAG: 50S ribosomal protein L6 [Deltaproteobacteria bacterium SG8_13]|nr:MAG: 50S ribosomal protein L6 [Deltaproteobacteria bacterium SG8_13]